MKAKIFTIFAFALMALSVVNAGSVFMFAMFDSTTTDSFTINDGDSEGLTISADSIFESSMNIKVQLIEGGIVIATLLDTTTTSDSYSKHLKITDSIYRNPGTYKIKSTVTASSGQTSTKELILRVVEPVSGNTAPEITSSPVNQINENTQYNYQVTAADADGDALSYSLTQKPSWLSINSNGLISGTSPGVSTDTQYVITVEVSDGKDFDRQTFTIDVLNVEGNGDGGDNGNGNQTNQTDTTSPVVSITSPVNGQTYNSDQNVIIFTASDANLSSCWYSLDNGQTNVTTQCNTAITGISSQSGQNTWTVYANDTSGNIGSDSVTFTVNIITTLEDEKDKNDDKINYQFSDPDKLRYLEQLEQGNKINKGDSIDITAETNQSIFQKFWNWLKSLFGF